MRSDTISQSRLHAVPRVRGRRFPIRFVAAATVLALEMCVVAALGHPWLPTHQITAGPIVFVAALLFFGRRSFAVHIFELEAASRKAIVLHVMALAAMLATSLNLLIAVAHGQPGSAIVVSAWVVALVLMAGSLIAAVVPVGELEKICLGLGAAWGYAALATVLALGAKSLARIAWDMPDSRAGRWLTEETFFSVRSVLGLFYHDLFSDTGTHILGTGTFKVQVAGVCSGIEGLTLTLILCLAWIVLERGQLRVLRVLWLVPWSLGMMWILNIARLSALIALGSAGYGKLAVTGFHTEAGWIAFTMVSLAFLLGASHMRWFRKDAGSKPVANAAVDLLLPFVAVCVISLLTRAASSGFEWLYVLRPLVAGLVLWQLRRRYLAMTWRAGWLDLVAGLYVGALWIALWVLVRHSPGEDGLAEGLAALSPSARASWLVFRTSSAVLMVPLVEELAFRGFVARRLVAEDVARVSYRALGPLAIVVSSLAFGLMHGNFWVPGTLAGAAFALLAKRRNSLGAAVLAHIGANAVVAAWVLLRGDYGLW